MLYSCITRLLRGGKRQVFPAVCVIEKDVKVNIMPVRTLCSIEFQGSCSNNLNLRRSENCIFWNLWPIDFLSMLYSCITRLRRGGKRQVFPAVCVIEKNVKVNIMRFRNLYSIEFQLEELLKHESSCFWKLLLPFFVFERWLYDSNEITCASFFELTKILFMIIERNRMNYFKCCQIS
jgi:hypothetical protein